MRNSKQIYHGIEISRKFQHLRGKFLDGNGIIYFDLNVVVVVVFTLKAVPVSTQYFLTSVLVQLTRTPSVVTG